jgi:uncharacterized protein YbjT (DUF2867 family)
MRIAIVGGTGTVGREAAAELARRGHDVRVLSRRTGFDVRADAPGDADVVVHAHQGGRGLLVGGSERLVAAAPLAHHVLVSVIGADRVPSRHFAAKLAQEDAVRAAGASFTLLRAAQVHSHVARRLRCAARFGVLACGPFPLQPVDPGEVGRALADTAEAEPSGAVTRLAGPEVATLSELALQWRSATGARARPVSLPLPGATGRALRAGALTEPGAWRGAVRFADWLGAGVEPAAARELAALADVVALDAVSAPSGSWTA